MPNSSQRLMVYDLTTRTWSDLGLEAISKPSLMR